MDSGPWPQSLHSFTPVRDLENEVRFVAPTMREFSGGVPTIQSGPIREAISQFIAARKTLWSPSNSLLRGTRSVNSARVEGLCSVISAF